jgi:outer membrane lipoprotein-sorting protein
VLVVSDGMNVAVFNKKLNTKDRYPLSTTPLNILLSDHVNLKGSSSVIGIDRKPGEIVVRARSNDRRVTGNITIVFSDPDLALKQWTVVDAQGLATTVTLRNVQTGVAIAPELFLTHG